MMRRLKLKRAISSLMIGLIVFTSSYTGTYETHVHASDSKEDLVTWYTFDDIDEETIKDASGHDNHASIVGDNYSIENWEDESVISLGGGDIKTGAHIKLPDNILEGLEDVTITTWVNMHGNQSYTRIFDFGGNATKYMYLTPTGQNDGAKGLAFGITESGWSKEQNAQKGTALERNEWIHLATVISGNTVTVYQDGKIVAENSELTLNPTNLGDMVANYIGRGQFEHDALINASFSDFRIYNRALKASELADLLEMTDQQAVEADKVAINLGNLRTIENDLVLPSEGQYGSDITWVSNNTDVIKNDGTVTRPEPGEGNVSLLLTATITKGSESLTREFEATVLAKLSDQEKVELDKNALSLGNLNYVTGDLDLPFVGRNASDISWESSDAKVISNIGEITRPEVGDGNATITLTATITNGDAADTREFTATVIERDFEKVLTEIEEVDVETTIGVAPELPKSVIGKYNDGSTHQLDVIWNEIDEADFQKAGKFVVKGTMEGSDIQATANVTVKQFVVSFSEDQLKPGETIEALVNGINLAENSLPVLVSMALYDAKGMLTDVSYANGNFEPDKSKSLQTDLVLPEDISGNTVKLFIWEGNNITESSLKPLSTVSELTDQTIIEEIKIPQDLTATPEETSEITISWSDVAGATGYDLEIDGNVIKDVTSPYVHKGLVYGSDHTYTVRAKNESGESAWSRYVNATVTSNPSSILETEPFSLGDVTLKESIFTENRDREYSYLESLDLDTLLYSFRVTAGMDTKGADPMTGWDAPADKLRGHSTGHYLSAIAQAYASSKDAKWKTRIDYMIDELEKIQEAMPTQDNGMEGTEVGAENPELVGKNSVGYLSAYPERQFILLENGAVYRSGSTDDTDIDAIWAPYYTLHKIMAGLLDVYEHTGNEKALEIVTNMADWVHGRLSLLPQKQLDEMWEKYIAGEYGGMNETLAQLSAVTGDKKYVDTAKMFDNENLFPAMENNEDVLGGLHANQHIPQITGALNVFDQTNDPDYYNVAKNFWDMVVDYRVYSNGGTGEGEHFHSPDDIAGTLGSGTAENCATYNMLKLTRDLFFHSPDAKYMDYYERGLYNGIVPSQDQSENNNGVVYFMPLGPGLKKSYGRSGFTCCAGTGLESQTKYQDSIYFRSANNESLYVNMYMPSKLNWEEKGFVIDQVTDFPSEEGSTITVNGSGDLDINLRVPSWAEQGFNVKINGVTQELNATPSTYVTLSRSWTEGDQIEISIPYSFRVEITPDDPHTGSIFYGPLLMVGKDDRDNYISLDIDKENPSRSIYETDNPLHFSTNGVDLVPMYEAYNFKYHAYFKINQ